MNVIGIDLGTTNSAAAIAEGNDVRCLPNRENKRLTPSVVSYFKSKRSDKSEIVVGQQAQNNAGRDPLNTIFSIKRLMGRVYGEPWEIHGKKIELAEVRRRVNYRIAETPPKQQEDQGIRVLLGDESYSPTQISTMILREVVAGAKLALGKQPTHAVITVPAYFNERQRFATQQAGEQAGLNVLRIVDEPTAAALAFGLGKEDERHRVLVYDLGGGTFDISIIQMTKGQYQQLATEGDNFLGGDDFDRVIMNRIIDCVKQEHGHDPSEDKAFLAKAKEEAESIKQELSIRANVERLFGPIKSDMGTLDITVALERDEFEELIRPHVDRTIELAKAALSGARCMPDDITQVLLVGGSTAVPLVQRAVIDLFGQEKVKRNVDPMECVAKGAAILASSLEVTDDGSIGNEQDENLVQTTAMHLGIAAVDGDNPNAFVTIIPKGTPYPLATPMKRRFRPTKDDQTLVRVPVYEGLNTKRADLNEQQGVIELPLSHGISSAAAVEVSFNFDKNRVLTVGVRVADTDEFVEKKLLHDRARVEQESLMDDWREELQPAIRAGQHFFENYGSYMAAEDRTELEEAIQQGEKALNANDRTTGDQARKLISNKLFYSSGVATQMFIAERTMAMPGVSQENIQHLADAVTSLRSACDNKDEDNIRRCEQGLKVLLPLVLRQAQAIDRVEDKVDFGNLLRTM